MGKNEYVFGRDIGGSRNIFGNLRIEQTFHGVTSSSAHGNLYWNKIIRTRYTIECSTKIELIACEVGYKIKQFIFRHINSVYESIVYALNYGVSMNFRGVLRDAGAYEGHIISLLN